MNVERYLEPRATALIEEYLDIIGQIFPGVVTLEEFGQVFNHFFTSYQRLNKQKMAPESIMAGNITCSSAAALVGVWWEQHTGTQPTYFLRKFDGETKTSSHVIAGIFLGSPEDTEVNHIPAHFMQQARTGSSVPHTGFYDYLPERGFGKATVNSEILPVIPIRGTKGFLTDRLKTFKINSQRLRLREAAKV